MTNPDNNSAIFLFPFFPASQKSIVILVWLMDQIQCVKSATKYIVEVGEWICPIYFTEMLALQYTVCARLVVDYGKSLPRPGKKCLFLSKQVRISLQFQQISLKYGIFSYFFIFFSHNHKISLQGASWFAYFFLVRRLPNKLAWRCAFEF